MYGRGGDDDLQRPREPLMPPETPQTEAGTGYQQFVHEETWRILKDEHPEWSGSQAQAEAQRRGLARIEKQARQAEHERVLALEKALREMDTEWSKRNTSFPENSALYLPEEIRRFLSVARAALAQQDTGHAEPTYRCHGCGQQVPMRDASKHDWNLEVTPTAQQDTGHEAGQAESTENAR